MSDDELVDGLKKHDMKYLHEFIDIYGKLIYGVLNSVLDKNHERHSIDECFDDVLLSIWYNIDCYDENKGKFVNWIISICKFKAIDYKRKSNKDYNLSDIDECNAEYNKSMEEEILLKEQKIELTNFINKLGEPDREIFNRRYFKEESIDDISKGLGIPKENIYNRLSRGRKKLKDLMEGYYDR